MTDKDKACCDTNEYSIWTFAKDFYNMKMLPFILIVWAFGIVCIVGAVWSAIEFFNTEDTRLLIMYAVIFIVFVIWLGMLKTFAWMMIHRNGLRRQISKLEAKIDELSKN